MATTNKITVNIDGENVELTGAAALPYIEAQKALEAEVSARLEAEQNAAIAKAEARNAVLAKLGLTADEVAALLG